MLSNCESGLYGFTAISLQGKKIAMDVYKGKVVLVVNTASKCGLTPQYEGLERLYRDYKDKGLVILGFPCNQFAGQEPGSAKQIFEGCLLRYGVSFPMFEKIDVNGKNAHPLYKYMKTNLKSCFGSAIKWNFSKFLIDRNGNPVKRFSPITTPQELHRHIEKLL